MLARLAGFMLASEPAVLLNAVLVDSAKAVVKFALEYNPTDKSPVRLLLGRRSTRASRRREREAQQPRRLC